MGCIWQPRRIGFYFNQMGPGSGQIKHQSWQTDFWKNDFWNVHGWSCPTGFNWLGPWRINVCWPKHRKFVPTWKVCSSVVHFSVFQFPAREKKLGNLGKIIFQFWILSTVWMKRRCGLFYHSNFYVKSILIILWALKMPFLPF